MHDIALKDEALARQRSFQIPGNRAEWLSAAALVVALVLTVPLAFGYSISWSEFAVLLSFSVLSDLKAIETATATIKLSGSFIAIVVACVTLSPAAGVWIGVITILAGWLKQRYKREWLWLNLACYSWFPLAIGATFHTGVALSPIEVGSIAYYALVAAAFIAGFLSNFLIIAGYTRATEGQSLAEQWRSLVVPAIPAEIPSLILVVIGTYVATQIGAVGLLIVGSLILIFQHMLGTTYSLALRSADLQTRSRQLTQIQFALIRALIETLHLRDPDAADHAAHTAAYARALAQRLGLSEDDQRTAQAAGVLHDIGKYSFPDTLFENRPDETLSPEDQEAIRRHPLDGASIVSQIDGYQRVAEVIACHHERPDGSGYPRGLRGTEIPQLAQIVGIASTYDALLRPGKGTLGTDPAIAMQVLKRAGYDRHLTEAFIAMICESEPAVRAARFARFEDELSEAEAYLRTL